MKELEEILNLIPRTTGAPVLATLVSVQGSTYRRPGARMLIVDGERRAGTISGGCLEAEVCRQAGELRADSPAKLVQFSTIDDDDVIFGYSLGCKGVIKILLQPLPPGQLPPVLQAVGHALREGTPAALATVYAADGEVPAPVGAQFLHSPVAPYVGHVFGDALREDLGQVLHTARGRNRVYELENGRADLFIEPIIAPVQLCIFGGGLDALPLAQLARQLGWRIAVVDPRPTETLARRFPMADRIIEAPPRTAAREAPLGARSAAVVMTHNFAHDRDLLASLLPAAHPRYIGLLGPRHRTQRLMRELAEQGVVMKDDHLRRLYTPAGLDIGTDQPEEIALAIVAEIQAVLSARSGGSLRDRLGDIHGDAARSPDGP